MKLLVYLSIILLGLHLATAAMYRNPEVFVPLVKRLLNLYSSSAVFFAFPTTVRKEIDALEITRMMHSWCRLLQSENIATLAITYDQIQSLEKYYYGSIASPLIVVLISHLQSFHEFSLITKSLRMYTASWIVVFTPSGLDDTYDHCYHPSGNPFHLSFNTRMLVMCYDDYVLREWYSVDRKTTEIFDLARWYPGKDLNASLAIDMLTDLSICQRRNNLKGAVLRGVTIQSSMLLTVQGKELKGFLGQVIKELEQALNFTIAFVAHEQDYGSFNITTKRWSGAMRLVASGSVDIGVSDFSMTNTRLDFVDFTIPLLTTRINLYIKEPGYFAVKWFAYYKGFGFTVWISIIVTILLAQCVITFVRCSIEPCHIGQTMRNEFIRMWGILCQQSLPARMRYVPFRTIEEFIKDGSYSVIVTRNSADYDMFAHSKDPLSLGMMNLMKPRHSLPRDVPTAYENICNDGKLALYTGYGVEMEKISTSLRIPCKLFSLNFGRVDSLSMILSKDNQYTTVLNYHLQKLLSTGVLDRSKRELNFEEAHTIQAVGIGSIISVLIVFFCSVALALIILIVEIYYVKYKHPEGFDRSSN
ncbi:uncharacterized protein LOC143373531 isoform X2 [Andrena cerasifolii]|uniref:uncharacterized protein LOC143373531 isoform X2 n=1 Tax=Andrena cerasifolii TaxID=2819439 RepID=UPI00403774DB